MVGVFTGLGVSPTVISITGRSYRVCDLCFVIFD